ncbi:MAG: type II secretion system F family protein [Methylotenera sp.]|nr:type II secretion system F family protein [Methylotenera sp.]OQW69921.1 MAG: type II secretion protein F [Proteobacteria bacterium ST_bin12]
MPTFQYKALNNLGKETKGSADASDARTAIANLRQQNIFVLEIEQDTDKKAGLSKELDLSSLTEWRSVSTQELIFFFKQQTFMLRAGLPVLQALQLGRTQASGRLGRVIDRMIADIENGFPLSQAVARNPKVFPPLAVSLISAGENTGELDLVMDRLADHLEKKAALKTQTINAMIYPIIVILAAIGVFIFLVIKIIPAFAKFFAGKGRGLPPSTQFLVDLSTFFVNYGLYILAIIIVIIISLVLMYQTKEGRYKLHNLLLRLPVLGKLMTVAAMAQLTWSLSMMLRSGLTALDALKITAKVIRNRVISDKTYAASDQILAGKDLASSLQHPRIPTIVTQMIAVGERTGTLDNVLHQLGDYYEERLQLGIRRLSAMVEPALILVIGGMVGFVYYAFFQALFALAKV